MVRDHTKLKVFGLADQLAEEVYRVTRAFPPEERPGLQAELRRAALGVPASIIQGSARQSAAEYRELLSAALGSAAQLKYLLGLSVRLELVTVEDGAALDPLCAELVRSLHSLIESLTKA